MAIHDSELTRALESVPASGATPKGSGTTGYQWWTSDWHYFVMPDAMKEALRSDGTPFTVVSDANISAGGLLSNGKPKYPIVISLASEAVRDDEVSQLTNYVAAGGFLFVGSSSFTRNTNGTTRGDFAIANAMGLHMVRPGLTNWNANNALSVQTGHRLVDDLPGGQLTWRMPAHSDEISWGTSPSHPFLASHDIWQVQASGATVLAQGDTYPCLLVKKYGNGYFIYHAAFQPLIGHGGFAPGMYAYMIFRRAIEWAFEADNLPITKLSPWPYPYDAAFMVRHDLENFTNEIAAIQASAQVEFNNGAKGDYYFCTGTVRDDAPNKSTIIAGLKTAVSSYGATIGPHNGGLKNPNNPSLIRGQYDYWHWGPDEALDVKPSGYASGKAYAFTSISNSFRDVEGWLSGVQSGPRTWVACYFNATREDSYDIQASLNVKVTGDQKLSPFPHWTLSTETRGKLYPMLSEPVSDWYVGGMVAQSLEPWHPPGVHNSQTMHEAVDYYYNLGALINIYSHTLSTGLGDAGPLVADYITYSLNESLHPRLWSANGVLIYQWWLQRSNAQVNVSYATNGFQSLITASIARATSTDTTIEILLPGTNSFCGLSVLANGVAASANSYRINERVIKVRVGTAVTNLVVSYYPGGPTSQVFSERFDGIAAPALPAGWTTTSSGAQSPWVTQTAAYDTWPNTAFSSDAANVGINELVSPLIALPAGAAQLSFRNRYDLEAGTGSVGYDGGVLEIKIGNGAFTDILTAGGNFVSGGYNTTIDTHYANPLAGRDAWSGSSGGFITTTVDLPAAAAGQAIQLKWRCGTDNGNGSTGWRIDTVTITNQLCLCCGNTITNAPPVLPGQVNRTILALTALTVTNTATDADLPAQTLSYQLVAPPTGAGIDTSGVISWTPTSGQAPSTNTVTTIVTDDGTPPLRATNSFVVVVNPLNTPPTLSPKSNRTVTELTTLSVNNPATDTDVPAQTLAYELLEPPAGASINSTGRITWRPSEEQGPGTYSMTTVVTDDGTPPLSATNSFTVTVNEANTAPTLSPQSSRTIAEQTTLTVTNMASDADLPANALNYTLLAAPAGAEISDGVITWMPTEAQGPSTNIFTTKVTDSGSPPLSATNSFTVTVTESNTAPNLSPQVPRTIAEQTTLTVTNTATDADVPTNTLSYALLAAPAGAEMSDGVVTWTPTEAQGPSTNTFKVKVTDNGAPALSATNTFVVVVTEVNSAPMLPSPTNLTILKLTTLTVTNTATDEDLPANALTYTLLNPPAGAAIGPNGIVTWTPAEAQASSTNLIRTVVTDDGSPALSATNSFTVIVTDTNKPPALPTQNPRTIAEFTLLIVTNTAIDANTLSYTLISPPTGAVISTNGVITWTPSEEQGPGAYTLTTVVTDDGSPPLSATNDVSVTVTEANTAPPLSPQPPRTISEQTTLTVTNTATDADIPANTLSYMLLDAPAGAEISDGVITWMPTEAQGPGTNTVTVRVTDNGSPPLSATNTLVVVVTEVNSAPVLPLQTNLTIFTLTPLTVTNTATDGDLPPNGLTYALLSPPSGVVIDTNGIITWTPAEAQVSTTNLIRTVVTDDGSPALSATNSFTVIVTEANRPPVLPLQNPRTIAESTTLTVTNTAADADTLTYVLISPPPGAAISTDGVITWTPSEDQGPGSYTLTTVVTDGGTPPLSATNSFTVAVTEVNEAPMLPLQTNRTVPVLTTLLVTNTATDPDFPANALSYSLVDPPAGATIDSNGVIAWTPAAAQMPSTNELTTVCSDDGNPALGSTNSFTVFVVPPGPLFTDDFTRAGDPGPLSPWVVQSGEWTVTGGILKGGLNSPATFGAAYVAADWTNYVVQAQVQFTNAAQGGGIGACLDPATGARYAAWLYPEGSLGGDRLLKLLKYQTWTSFSYRGTNYAPIQEVNLASVGTAWHLLEMSVSNALITVSYGTNQVISVVDVEETPYAGGGITAEIGPSSAGHTMLVDNVMVNALTSLSGVIAPHTNAPPLIEAVAMANGGVMLRWSAVSGSTYRLQFSDNLESPAWNDIMPDVLATATTASATNNLGGSPQRFYRVLLLQ